MTGTGMPHGKRWPATLFVGGSVILLSLWLRLAFPALGIWAPHDDLLFIRLAGYLGGGDWLGPYDSMVLAKGMFFPAFLHATQTLGLPLKLAEHILYLAVAAIAAFAIARTTNRSWLLLPIFSVLALSPLPWMDIWARVVREPLYQSLSLAVFFLAALYLLAPQPRRSLGLALGVAFGSYWLTREEGLWLMPALAFLVLPRLVEALRDGPPSAWVRKTLTLLAPPVLAGILVIALVNTLNFFAYGVFRGNEFRSGPFASAYGALARISHDRWQRYVVFPRDARQRAYSASPAARELERYFEGDVARNWVVASRNYPPPWGCAHDPTSCNDEILSGWFVWALRDAVAAAGHYRSAPEADAYYTRLAKEIDGACDSGAIPCGPPNSGLAPPWRSHYLGDAAAASREVLDILLAMNSGRIGVPASRLAPEQAGLFQNAVGAPLSGAGQADSALPKSSCLTELRMDIAGAIAKVYSMAGPPLFALAFVAYLAFLIARLAGKPIVSDTSLLLLSALVTAVATRVAILGYLEATSIPSKTLLYLSPAVPFFQAFIVISLGLAGAAFASRSRGRAAHAAGGNAK